MMVKLILTLFVCIIFKELSASVTELQPTKLTFTRNGNELKYSVKYRSPGQAVVVWFTANGDSPHGAVDTYNVESNEGESRISLPSDIKHEFFAVTLHRATSDIAYTYEFSQSSTQTDLDLDLPEFRIWSPIGNNWNYNEGVPFTIPIHFTHVPGAWCFRSFEYWVTDGISSQIVAISNNDQRNLIKKGELVEHDVYDEVPIEVNLTTQQGIALVHSHCSLHENVSFTADKMFSIFEHDQSGPFPEDFFAAVNMFELYGMRGKPCELGSACTTTCNGFGSNIASIEMHKTGTSQSLLPRYVVRWGHMATALFDVTPTDEEDFGNYTCTVLNDEGETSETVYLIYNQST